MEIRLKQCKYVVNAVCVVTEMILYFHFLSHANMTVFIQYTGFYISIIYEYISIFIATKYQHQIEI